MLILDSSNNMVSSLVDGLIWLIWIADSEYQETNKLGWLERNVFGVRVYIVKKRDKYFNALFVSSHSAAFE